MTVRRLQELIDGYLREAGLDPDAQVRVELWGDDGERALDRPALCGSCDAKEGTFTVFATLPAGR
jgi:hypothetical protein